MTRTNDSVFITMQVTTDEKMATSSRMVSCFDEIRAARFDFVQFEFDQLAAPLKDLVIQLLDDRYDGPVTISVGSRAGERELKNEKTTLNHELKAIVHRETRRRGILPYGWQQQALARHLVNVLFDEAAEPVKKSLTEECRIAGQ